MALGAVNHRTRAAMRRACVLAATLGSLLSGCAQQSAPGPKGGTARLEPGMGFFFNQDGETGQLAYGRANSDDVLLMLACARGARTVKITDVANEPLKSGPAALTLISGAARSELRAAVDLDDSGPTVAVAQAPTDLEALMGFRRTGDIAVKLGSRTYALSATAAERVQIARFFSGCEH